jgi:hypothetical protein
MDDEYQSYPDIEDAHEQLTQAIGLLVIPFNYLETSMGMALARVLGQDESTAQSSPRI